MLLPSSSLRRSSPLPLVAKELSLRPIASLRLCVRVSVLALLIAPLAAAEELAPLDGFLGHWHKQGTVRVFKGSDLYGHIDGGSELFLEFGFEELSVQRYTQGADEFSLEIYRMTDPLAAAGIFLMKQGTPAKGALLPTPYALSPYQLMFAYHRYLVVLNNAEGTASRQPDMVEFGRYIIAKLPPGSPPAPEQFLPTEGLVPGSFRLIRGDYALQSIFSLGPANALNLTPGQTAAAGDYRVDKETWTLIICSYPDAAKAQTAFERLSNQLDANLKVTRRETSGLVFEDYANEYGTIRVLENRVEVRLHLSKGHEPLPRK